MRSAMLLKITILLSLAGGFSAVDTLGFAELMKLYDGLKDGDGKCEFICPDEVKPKADPIYEPITDGCLAEGIEVGKFVEDYPKFSKCCDKHDLCYQVCNKDRDICDVDLKKCLLDTCDRSLKYGSEKSDHCRGYASKIHGRFNGTACGNYQDAQRHACLCKGKKIGKDKMWELVNEKKKQMKEKKDKTMKTFGAMNKTTKVEL